jgi:uncharacterized protein (TIGR02117 family)
VLTGSLALPLANCTAAPPVRRAELVQGSEPVYVIAAGWHTDIGLPVLRITAPLGSIRSDFPDAQWLEFGWGQREVYMNPEPSLGELLRSALPGPSVMMVRSLPRPPPEALGAPARVVTLLASTEGLARLCDYVWDFLAKDPAGRPYRVGPGPCGDCVFYASDGTYDLNHTCNTWTAEVLRAGGFPVNPEGVITAGEVMQQIS